MPRAGKRSESDSEEDHEQSKLASSKRRRIANAFVPTFKQDLSSEDDDDSEDDADSDSDAASDQVEAVQIDAQGESDNVSQDPDDGEIHASRPKPAAIKLLTPAELQALNAAKARTGVLYLSKVPPFMKPQKVKHLLSAYGETNRIFLAPEDPKSYAKRVRFGGNKRRMFTEGWIEFTDKKKAKLVAETLNAQKIGGKKKSFYHDDLWNLKYLPKFKWDDLTAQIAAENASRQARLAAEIEQGKREASHYIKNAERAKMIDNIKKTRRERSAGDAGTTQSAEADVGTKEERIRRHFNQRDVKDKTKAAKTPGEQDQKMTKVMSSLFG